MQQISICGQLHVHARSVLLTSCYVRMHASVTAFSIQPYELALRLLQVQDLQRRKIPSPMTEAERRINKQILQDIAKLKVSHEAGFTIPAAH